MFRPEIDPESGEGRGPRRGRDIPSDSVCPWCQSTQITRRKHMPSPRGLGVLVYIIFPIALAHWLATPTYNECESCAGRWQRGVHVTPTRAAPDDRAGMYREQVPTAAVVRRRPRLGAPGAGHDARDRRDVRVVASRGACRTCRAADGQYAADNAPTLPIVGCTCAGGCTCALEPIDDGSPKQTDD